MVTAITGGAGFIGTHLVKRLIERGEEPIVVDNFSSHATDRQRLEAAGAKVYDADILDTERLTEIFGGVDGVVHLAALIDVRESEIETIRYARVNILGTVSVLKACEKAGVGKIVFASSAAVYGTPRKLPISETHGLEPISFYGYTKAAGEEACRLFSKRGLECTVLRIFNAYGELGRKNVIYKFLKNMYLGKTITVYGTGGQTRDFIYAGDIVDAIERVLARRRGGFEVYNLATGIETTVNSLIRTMEKITGLKAKISRVSPRRGEILRSVADTSKMRKILGFKPRTSLEQGIVRVYEWIKGGEYPIL